MTKLKVKIKQGAFPVRYDGERYNAGDELVIDKKHLHPSFEVIETIEEDNVDPFKEFENKSVEELQAYAEEHNIDIGNATSVNGIIKKIKEASKKTE